MPTLACPLAVVVADYDSQYGSRLFTFTFCASRLRLSVFSLFFVAHAVGRLKAPIESKCYKVHTPSVKTFHVHSRGRLQRCGTEAWACKAGSGCLAGG